MNGMWRWFDVRERNAMKLTFPLAILFAAVALVGCGEESFTLDAAGPFPYVAEYPVAVNPPPGRVAIVVTITNRSGDDLLVNPADFVARDSDRHIYAANPAATVADSRLVRLAIGAQGLDDIPPLPSVTLRQDDVLSGFVVFDVPAGVRPVALIWRHVDGDRVVQLSPTR